MINILDMKEEGSIIYLTKRIFDVIPLNGTFLEQTLSEIQ